MPESLPLTLALPNFEHLERRIREAKMAAEKGLHSLDGYITAHSRQQGKEEAGSPSSPATETKDSGGRRQAQPEAAAGEGQAGSRPRRKRPDFDPFHNPRLGSWWDPARPRYEPQSAEALREVETRFAMERALADARSALVGRLAALLAHIPPPPVALGGIDLVGREANVYVHVVDEKVPRVFHGAQGRMGLGAGYRSLHVSLEAEPGRRDASQKKCTLVNPFAKRHLRDTLPDRKMFGIKEAPAAGTGEDEPVPVPIYDLRRSQPPPRIWIDVRADRLGLPGVSPFLEVTVRGRGIHAPMVERLLEVPIDVNEGTFNGWIKIKSDDPKSWQFPRLYGRVRCTGMDFHFWDATDDIQDARFDLLFEDDRLYLHNATGYFGAVPLSLTGDLGLNPDEGQYRLTVESPGVEVNALRCTLGVRPTPYPVAGSVRGIVHVTGPLEKPVFSGHVVAMPSSAEVLAASPQSWALDAMVAAAEEHGTVVGAYDKVPFTRACAVFSLDMATEMLDLHSFGATTVDGGELSGSGSMWLAPQAEMDPRAINMAATVKNIPLKTLALQYLSKDMASSLPPALDSVGRGMAQGTMTGAHLSPLFDINWSAPDMGAQGLAAISPERFEVAARSPTVSANVVLHTRPHDPDTIRGARTQEQAFLAGRPVVEGCDLDLELFGLDAKHFLGTGESLTLPPALRDFPRAKELRMRAHGRVRFSGDVINEEVTRTISGSEVPVAFPRALSGSLQLDDLRINQLSLAGSMKGTLSCDEHKLDAEASSADKEERIQVSLQLGQSPSQAEEADVPATTVAMVDATEREHRREPVSWSVRGLETIAGLKKLGILSSESITATIRSWLPKEWGDTNELLPPEVQSTLMADKISSEPTSMAVQRDVSGASPSEPFDGGLISIRSRRGTKIDIKRDFANTKLGETGILLRMQNEQQLISDSLLFSMQRWM